MAHLFKPCFIVMLLVSVSSLNLQGTYQLSYLNSNISNPQNITFKITDRYISIRGGCNTQTGYSVFNDDGSAKFGPFLSTAEQKVCTNNSDSLLINSFLDASTYNINSDRSISLFNQQKSILLNLTLL